MHCVRCRCIQNVFLWLFPVCIHIYINMCFVSLLVIQEYMTSGGRRLVFLWRRKTCLLVMQEYLCSCVTRRHVCLSYKNAFLLVFPQADITCFLNIYCKAHMIGPTREHAKLNTYHFYSMSFWTPPEALFCLFFLGGAGRFEGCRVTALT